MVANPADVGMGDIDQQHDDNEGEKDQAEGGENAVPYLQVLYGPARIKAGLTDAGFVDGDDTLNFRIFLHAADAVADGIRNVKEGLRVGAGDGVIAEQAIDGRFGNAG